MPPKKGVNAGAAKPGNAKTQAKSPAKTGGKPTSISKTTGKPGRLSVGSTGLGKEVPAGGSGKKGSSAQPGKLPTASTGKKQYKVHGIDPLFDDDPKLVLKTFYIRRLLQCVWFWERFLAFPGRYPFSCKITRGTGPIGSREAFEGFTCLWYFDKKSFATKAYIVVQTFVTIVAVLYWLNLVSAVMDIPSIVRGPWEPVKDPVPRFYEKVLIYRHWLVFGELLFGTTIMAISGWQLFYNRHRICVVLNMLANLCEVQRVDVKPYFHSDMIAAYIFYFAVTLSLMTLTAMSYYIYLAVQPGLAVYLTCRMFNPKIHMDENLGMYRMIALPFYLFIYLTQHYVFLIYIFILRILQIIIQIYNARLEQILSADIENAKVRKYRKSLPASAFRRLYLQFLAMRDVVDKLNDIFEPILWIYYGLGGWQLLFEVYYLTKLLLFPEEVFEGSRIWDIFIIVVCMTQTFTMLFLVGMESAATTEDCFYHSYIYCCRRCVEDLEYGTTAERVYAQNICSQFGGQSEISVGGRQYVGLSRRAVFLFIMVIQDFLLVIGQFNPEINYNYPPGFIYTNKTERAAMYARFEGLAWKGTGYFNYRPDDGALMKEPYVEEASERTTLVPLDYIYDS